jgi:hypothetical protein
MRPPRKSSIPAAVLIALAGGLLAACGSSDMSPNGAVADGAGISAESMPVENQATQAPQVIQTANVTIEVDDVDNVVTNITANVDARDGFVQSRSVNRYDNDATASMTIRIPAADLESFIASLANEGEVLTSTIDAQDVTIEVIDLEARISTLESSIDRLRELQAQATSVADLVAVESELATRQSELESLTARRDYLDNQVDLSTVYLWIDQVDSGAALTPDFLGGLQRGWDALLTLGAGLITGVGFLLPTALVGLAIAAVVFIIVRLLRNRKTREDQS